MATNERFVVLGVAPVRREWFRRVGRWANEATLPVEFVKCISITEVISRLESGRPFSALLVDASSTGLDRDLLDLANAVGCSPIIVDHGLVDRDWDDLGARAVIPERFEAADLRNLLDEIALPIGRTATSNLEPDSGEVAPTQRGRVITLTGAGGLGTTTLAMAMTQGLAANSNTHPVLLADMALRSNQAMFHDARDVVPGLTELIESHRLGVPNVSDATASIHAFPERGYDLLFGLRHERDWISIPSRALAATWDTLTTHYRTIVCDITGEFDGAQETGSDDIEDRNRLARTAALRADLVGVIGAPGAWGVHHLVRTLLSLIDLGVPPARLVPIINHAPRQPRARAGLTTAVAELVRGRIADAEQLPSPIFVPARRNLEATLRDGDPIPGTIAGPLASTFGALIDKANSDASPTPPEAELPVAVTPGSLGTWSDDDD